MHLNEAAFSYFRASHLTFFTFCNVSSNDIYPVADSGLCVLCVSIPQWVGKCPVKERMKWPECWSAPSSQYRRGLDIIERCLKDANVLHPPIWKEKKSLIIASFVFILALTVKPLSDHPQRILLSQSCTSTQTDMNICCYSAKKREQPV